MWPNALVKTPPAISFANFAPFKLGIEHQYSDATHVIALIDWGHQISPRLCLCWEGWFPKPCNLMLLCYCHIACFQESLQWSQTSFSFQWGFIFVGFEGVLQSKTKQHLVLIQQFLGQFTFFSNILLSHAIYWLTTTRTRYTFEHIKGSSSQLVFCQG